MLVHRLGLQLAHRRHMLFKQKPFIGQRTVNNMLVLYVRFVLKCMLMEFALFHNVINSSSPCAK